MFQIFLGANKFLANKKFGSRNILGGKKNSVGKNLGQFFFGRKNVWVNKLLGQNFFGANIFYGGKNLIWLKEILGQKNFGSKKFGPTFFGGSGNFFWFIIFFCQYFLVGQKNLVNFFLDLLGFF